jgi:hypothetical protein
MEEGGEGVSPSEGSYFPTADTPLQFFQNFKPVSSHLSNRQRVFQKSEWRIAQRSLAVLIAGLVWADPKVLRDRSGFTARDEIEEPQPA